MKHKPSVLPLDWMEAIWSTDLPSNAKLLCAYLRSFMNAKNDMAWPAYAKICAETGLSKSTAAKYFDLLESEGWIARNRGNSKKSTQYIACYPQVINQAMGSARAGVLNDSNSPSNGQRSARAGVRVVREPDTNKQGNKQCNKQLVIPDGINRESWNEWIEYRKTKRKKVSELAAKKQFTLLAKYSLDQQKAIIDKSITNDYQGLFDISKNEAKINDVGFVEKHTNRAWREGL